MMTLEQARGCIGRTVIYARYDDRSDPTRVTAGPERGAITSVGERYVFVRYGINVQSQATDPADLTLELR